MGESKGSRNKPICSWINNLWQRSQEYKIEKAASSKAAWKTGQTLAKTWI